MNTNKTLLDNAKTPEEKVYLIAKALRDSDRSIDDDLWYAIKALKPKPCDDCISRQSVLDEAFQVDTKEYGRIDVIGVDTINTLLSVTPQPKTGCKGCKYEETGSNTTYPCSHCSRCYTDKYKAENESRK